jgi:predicted nucleotidyltransferase
MPIVVNVEDSELLRGPIDRAFQAGFAEGMIEGKIEGMASVLAIVLANKFGGDVPHGLKGRLAKLSPETLKIMLDAAIDARTIDDVLAHSTGTTDEKAPAPAESPSDPLEGVTPSVAHALTLFSEAVQAAYGPRLVRLLLFGSRARGTAKRNSDADVVVVLDEVADAWRERERLSDLAYDIIVETGEHVQAWPVSVEQWDKPEAARNPRLVQAMKRDGIAIQGGRHEAPPS